MLESKQFKDSLFSPRERGVLLIDVVDYSKYDILYQSSVLSIFNQALKYSLQKFRKFSGENCLEQIIPTGDGCYMVFSECVNDYFLKAVYMLFSEMNNMQDTLIGKYSDPPNKCEKMDLRFGDSIGQTDFFYDPAGRKNCYGTGMNETERILSLGRKQAESISANASDNTVDSFFVDWSLREQAEELVNILNEKGHLTELVDLGIISDKHGLERSVGWLRHLPPFEEISL